MTRVRGLELLFNLEKKNLKSKEDCVVIALHCLLINGNHQCVGVGDEWPEKDAVSTELLPNDWNSDQDVYSLRYKSQDEKSRILLKIIKMEHILAVDAVMNEEKFASTSFPINDYISDDYSTFESAYKDLKSLGESFQKNIIQDFKPKKEKVSSSKTPHSPTRSTSVPSPPLSTRPPNLKKREIFEPPRFPRVGGSDLDPFGGSYGGGMFMDPSSFGIPARPTLPQFGVGGPGGLPRGAVPPGARFDPFMPPIRGGGGFYPDPDHFRPPNFDDFM